MTELKGEYDDMFMSAAFSADAEELNTNIEKIKQLNKKYLQKKRHVHIVTDELLFLYHSFSGESKTNLWELYMKSGFLEYSEKKVKSLQWDISAQGVREVAEMRDERILPTLKKLSNSSNKLVQENVQLSLVKINGFRGLDFLSTVETPISDWQQINLIEVLKEYTNTPIPDFTIWLSSTEKTVILFAVRLIHQFKQIDRSNKLIPFLDYGDVKIKTEVIRTLVGFNKSEILDTLIKKYEQESFIIKLEIIKAYSFLSQSDDVAILAKWIINTTDLEIQKNCVEAVINLYALDKLKELCATNDVLKNKVELLLDKGLS